MITKEEKRAILNEVLELSGIPDPIKDDEFTITEFAEEHDISKSAAGRRLNQMVRDGLLERRRARINGNYEVWAYRLG